MSVKKLLAIFLTAFLVLSLGLSMAACFGGDVVDEDDYDYEDDMTTTVATEEETEPSLPALDMTGTNVIDGQAEFTYVRAYSATKVESPNPQKKGTSFEAKEGERYLVLHLNVTNISSETKGVDDLFKVFLYNDDFGNGTMSAVVEPEAHRLDRSHKLAPNESALVYFMVRCPDTVDLSKMTIEIASETNGYIGEADFSTDFAYAEESPKFAKGDVLDGKYEGNVIAGNPATTFTVSVQDIYAADSLIAPNAVVGSTYWPDQASSQYVIVKLSVKNTGSADLSYWNMVGMHCKYNNTTKYDSFFVTEIDGGQDLKMCSASMMLAPQEETILYFVMDVPDQQISGPLEITMYVGRDMYTCQFPV